MKVTLNSNLKKDGKKFSPNEIYDLEKKLGFAKIPKELEDIIIPYDGEKKETEFISERRKEKANNIETTKEEKTLEDDVVNPLDIDLENI